MKPGDLNSREDTTDNERCRNEIALLVCRKMSSIGQDDRWRYNTSQHSKCMLKSKKQSQKHRHTVMETEERCRTTSLLHKGKVGLEKEGIVIGSNETIPKQWSVVELEHRV